jgi:hypothetical protein
MVVSCVQLASLSTACGTTPESPPTLPAVHYVTTNGTSAGDGSSGNPWDLRTALAGGKGRVHAGDTIWVRGGTYAGSFTSGLRGTASAPIVVRQYPGERATLDGAAAGDGIPTLIVDGAWTVLWGLEVMNSRLDRLSPDLNIRQPGVYVRNASNVKLINLVVHDVGQGVFLEPGAPSIEIYGWIIYNGGNETPTRSAGHAIYIKNDGVGVKRVRDNVMFNNFGFGIHAYADSGTGPLKNMRFTGNVAFNNGTLSTYPSHNFQVGGDDVADAILADSNMLYTSPGVAYGNARIGYSTTHNGTMTFRDNYVVGGAPVMDVGYWQELTVSGNTLLGASQMVLLRDPRTTGQQWTGDLHHRDPVATAWRYVATDYEFSAWQGATGLGATDAATALPPAATKVFVRPNVYEPGRAHIVIYNWSGLSSVAVDVAGLLHGGDVYEVRSVQAVFGPPLLSGTYGGGTISIPMGGVTPPAPIGGSPNPPITTGPLFDVFLLTRTH